MAYRLRMPAQLGDWLAELQASEPVTAAEVGATLVAVLDADELPGPPLVTDPSELGPADPRETLDRTYQDLLERLQGVRRRVANVATHRKHTERRVSELRAAPDHDPAELAVLERQAAEARRAEDELTDRSWRLQRRVDAFRTQKETIKATYTAAEAQNRIREAAEEVDRLLTQADRMWWSEAAPDSADNADSATMAGADETSPGKPAGEADTDLDESVSTETIRRYQAPSPDPDLAPDPADPPDLLGPAGTAPAADAGPEQRDRPVPDGAAQRSRSEAESDVLALNADPFAADVRILFAIEPEGTLILLTVLEGTQAIRDSQDEAIQLAGELLAETRAERSPVASDETGYDWLEFAGAAPFLQRFFADNGEAILERAAALAAAESLAGLRQRRGMSLTEMARASGIGTWRLSMIEQGGWQSAAVCEVAAYVRALGGRLELTASLDGERHGLA